MFNFGGTGLSSRKDFLSCLILSRVVSTLLRSWPLVVDDDETSSGLLRTNLSDPLSVVKLIGD